MLFDIVVNDTNIFIDLYSVDLLESIFKLPYKFHTTDFVLSEITDTKQYHCIEYFVSKGDLFLKSFNEEEVYSIASFYNEQTNNMTMTDCSVCVYAKDNGYRLLTGDNNTRKVAEKNNIKVNGILFLFEEMLREGIISYNVAISKIKELRLKNSRLPYKEIDRLITEWSKMEN